MAKVKCNYCGNQVDDFLTNCPVCRNPLPVNGPTKGPVLNYDAPKYIKTEHAVPTTIEEFQKLIVVNSYPSAEASHFYIGQNVSHPKAFGICKEFNSIIIYLNKADGTRVIKYRGNDEQYAVTSFYKIYKEKVIDKLNAQPSAHIRPMMERPAPIATQNPINLKPREEKTAETAVVHESVQETDSIQQSSKLNLQKTAEPTTEEDNKKKNNKKAKKEKPVKEKKQKEPKQQKKEKEPKAPREPKPKKEKDTKTTILVGVLVFVLIIGLAAFAALVPIKEDKTAIEMVIELIKGEEEAPVIEEEPVAEVQEEYNENEELKHLSYYIGDDEKLYFYEGYHLDQLTGEAVYQWWSFDEATKTWDIVTTTEEDGIFLDTITKQYALTLDEAAERMVMTTTEVDIDRSQKYMDEGQHYPPFAMYYKLNDEIYVYFSDDFLFEKEDESGWYKYNTENGRWDFFRGPNDKSVGNELWYYPQDYIVCTLDSYDLYQEELGVPSFSETTQYKTYLENKKVFDEYQESIALNQPTEDMPAESTLEVDEETVDAPVAESETIISSNSEELVTETE